MQNITMEELCTNGENSLNNVIFINEIEVNVMPWPDNWNWQI